MRVLGVMSGTSLDAVDYVIVSFSPAGEIRFEEHWQVSFPARLRRDLLAAASGQATSWQTGQLHHDLGRFYALGAKRAQVELAGLHGQTIFHRPNRSAPATFQIGEPAYLAETLRIPVVSNFRAADLAAGGQGAPLATLFHARVFARKGRHVAVNNLGGISNVTSLDWRLNQEPAVLSFDTGPANLLIDLAVQRFTRGKSGFDRGGRLARRGAIDHRAVERWLKHPFFRQSPPKSTGRERFGAAFLDRVANQLAGPDLIATLAEFTARSIALNYRLHLGAIPDRVILCGGGAENPFLRERLDEALRDRRGEIEVLGSAELGWRPETIEGAAFALLAWLRWKDQPGNIPSTTGARRACVLGQVTG